MGRDTFPYPRLLQAPSNLALDTSRDPGAATASAVLCSEALLSPPRGLFWVCYQNCHQALLKPNQHQEIVKIITGKEFLALREVRPWHRVSREAVAAPGSLEVSKARLDGTWSNLVCGKCSCPWQGMERDEF